MRKSWVGFTTVPTRSRRRVLLLIRTPGDLLDHLQHVGGPEVVFSEWAETHSPPWTRARYGRPWSCLWFWPASMMATTRSPWTRAWWCLWFQPEVHGGHHVVIVGVQIEDG